MKKQHATVAQLLNGSKKIDQMRKEICDLVALIAGSIRNTYKPSMVPEGYRSISESGPGRWRILGSLRKESDDHYSMQISWGYPIFYYDEFGSGDTFNKIPMRLVADVHRDLSSLIEIVYKQFPLAAEAWEPLIEATEM